MVPGATGPIDMTTAGEKFSTAPIWNAANTKSADKDSHNTRQSDGFLAGKYGLRLLEKLKVVMHAVPAEVPEEQRLASERREEDGARLVKNRRSLLRFGVLDCTTVGFSLSQALFFQIISEICGLPLANTQEALTELHQLAPRYLDETQRTAPVEILCPPVLYCLNDCRYRIGPNKGDRRRLKWQRRPTEAKLYTVDGTIIKLGVLILRCTGCRSRYGYQMWQKDNHYYFYERRRDYMEVTQGLFVPASFASFIANSVYSEHATYEGIAATFQNTYPGYEGTVTHIENSTGRIPVG